MYTVIPHLIKNEILNDFIYCLTCFCLGTTVLMQLKEAVQEKTKQAATTSQTKTKYII
jgi:hypothetical protein